jgi:mannose-1-phosphate guanylyltransferase
MIIPVILSGGSGTRLWPLSRKSKPKQFIKLTGEKSLFHKTAKRVMEDKAFKDILVSCNEKHSEFVQKEFKNLGIKGSIIIEPIGRNTAPAICSISLLAEEKFQEDDVIIALPSDAYIKESEKFKEYVKKGEELAKKGYIVIFSVIPSRPETAYGYIKKGTRLNEDAFIVDEFVEKPNIEKAWRFLEDGNYSWNCGMFMYKASTMIKNFKKLEPSVYNNCLDAYKKARKSGNKIYLDKIEFAKCSDVSIDYSIMERTDAKIAVIPMDITWSDLGSFDSLHENQEGKDNNGNIIKGDVLIEDVKNSYIRSETNDKTLAVVGLHEVAVVQTEDVILVLNKEKAQTIRGIIKQIKEKRKELIQ